MEWALGEIIGETIVLVVTSIARKFSSKKKE